jgi:F0F1-type ATP synthase assembly protein I
MSEADNKQRNRQIAENESERQTVSAIRVSTWAIAAAVLIGIAAFGWVMLR